jgi:hypothetical protein
VTGNDGGEDEYFVEGGDEVTSVSMEAMEVERLFWSMESSDAWEERFFLCLLKICNMS